MTGKRWIGIGCAALLLGSATAGGALAVRHVLPDGNEVAEGVLLGGVAVPAGRLPEQVARERADRLLDRSLRLVGEDRAEIDRATLRELGATVDLEQVAAALSAVGRRGTLWERLDDAWQARQGKLAVALPLRLPLEPLAARLSAYKTAHDILPLPAKWDHEAGAATEHRTGALVDVYGAAEAMAKLAGSRASEVELPILPLEPAVTSTVAATIDRSRVLSRYETRFAFLGSQVGRAKNIARAAAQLDGQVMMPGAVLSFNELVGPRSIENGFAQAGEIYKGELRMGIGGGTCQVASTFHAAAYMGGLDITQRSPHSRPSGYIGLGLDATVAYPHVDMKLRNPFDFPIILRAHADTGTLTLELMGAKRPATVKFFAATVGVRPYKRKVREASWLAEGRIIRKQKGIRGVTVEKTRRILYADGTRRVETTTDIYPPTNEVYYVPPGTDVEADLPPLPDDGATTEARADPDAPAAERQVDS
ncbi:MAG: VanW family protein [Deltaproteobacteria bacterium]|nr:VanW family protein [Deltaproteobacteria bacterium]